MQLWKSVHMFLFGYLFSIPLAEHTRMKITGTCGTPSLIFWGNGGSPLGAFLWAKPFMFPPSVHDGFNFCILTKTCTFLKFKLNLFLIDTQKHKNYTTYMIPCFDICICYIISQ
jgi:hypothetical protein